MRSLLPLLLLVLTFSLVDAQDFTLYDNPFMGGLFPEVAPDGTLWFRSGDASVVGLVPSSGMHMSVRIKASTLIGGLTIDPQGGVWTATADRVDHISGGKVETYQFQQRTAAIAAAPDGSVWLSIGGDYLLRFQDGSWDAVPGRPDGCALAICFEADGTGWFMKPGPGKNLWLARYSNGEWTLFQDNVPTSPQICMAAGERGEVWVTDQNFVRRYQDGLLADLYDAASGLPGSFPYCVDVDTQSRVWVGDYLSGVCMFDRHNWTAYNTVNSGLPSNVVKGVAASPDGTVFFCTSEGIASYNNGLWNNYAGATLMNNDVWSVAVNQQGQVFYGTDLGQLGYYQAPNWEVLYRPEVPIFCQVHDIAFDSSGGVWFGQSDMLRMWRGTFVNYPRAGTDGIVLSYCKRLCCDQADCVWVCAKDGLARYAGTSWASWETDHANGISPESITCDHEGKVWVGVPPGVAALEREILVNWLPQYSNVTAMACDQDGLLWFGFGVSERGVLEFDGTNELAWYTTDDGLPSNSITCIECDSTNHIWVGTSDGLGYFDRTAWTKFDVDSGFAVNEIRDIAVAPNGDVWFATPAGLLCRESGIEPPRLSISIATDRDVYRAGETMTVSLSYNNPGPAVFVDIQVACQLPDGSLFYYPGGDTPVPFSSGMLPSGASIPMILVLAYEFPSDFPVGDYTWMTAMFQQGTFNILTDIATAPFTFQ